MDPVATPDYLRQLRGIRKWSSRIEVLDGLDKTVLATINTGISGTVEVERENVRRRLSLEIAGTSGLDLGTDLVGENRRYGTLGEDYGTMGGGYYGEYRRELLDGLLVPGVNEIRVLKGLQVKGITRWTGLGVFRIEEYKTADNGASLAVSVTGMDRSVGISANRWTKPYVVRAGNAITRIRELVANRAPRTVFDFPATNHLVAQSVLGLDADNDPWDDALRLSANIGMELYFDGEGICTMRPLPNQTAAAVETLTDDEFDMKVSLERNLNADKVYNGVIVTSDNLNVQGKSIWAEAWDLVPTSPTYRDGPFGRKPMFQASNFITTQAQAQEVADVLLSEVIGFDETLTIEMAMHPALEPSDVVRIMRARSMIDNNYILERYSIPVGPTGTQSCEFRRRVA